MLAQLIWKEIQYQTRSITFYLFIAVILMFYMTQFVPYIDQEALLKPQPGRQSYGLKAVGDEETEIKVVYQNMDTAYKAGYILKQGLLINKTVRLSDEQKLEIKAAMDKLAYYKDYQEQALLANIQVKADYHEYLEIVRGLDKALGGSTYFGDKYRKLILNQPMTYEDALSEFEGIKDKDKITNAYGRVFADYMGITAGLFPIFLSAFVLTRDKRSRMQELIYSRSISSIKYITAKYIALLSLFTLCYLALAVHASYEIISIANQAGYTVELLGIIKYAVLWVIPTLMFTTAVGMLLSIAFDNGVAAIFAQFVLWLTSITSLGGSYELYRSVVRFNTLGAYDSYMSWLPQIAANRIFFTVLSIVLALAAAWVLSLKRGSVSGFKQVKANPIQLQDTV